MNTCIFPFPQQLNNFYNEYVCDCFWFIYVLYCAVCCICIRAYIPCSHVYNFRRPFPYPCNILYYSFFDSHKHIRVLFLAGPLGISTIPFLTMPIPSLQLKDNENILLILHRHWFVLVRELAAIGVVVLIGLMVFSSRASLYAETTLIDPLAWFILSIFFLCILSFAFGLWVTYRLDVWIITTKRIIDVEQRGLFNREVSEFLISKVQNVTTETPTFIATMLDFGNMVIETAGEKSFIVREVPHMEKAKQIILEYSSKAQQETKST